jgi:hypothetical protein
VKDKSGAGLVDEIERLLKATSQKDPLVRAAVIRALASRRSGGESLWQWAVAGLLLLATVAVAGLLYREADGNPATAPELALTASVVVLSGLLGLLVGATWRGTAAG